MVPLVDQGKLLGKFMVYYATYHAFDVEEVRFMLTLASTIAFAITRKRAEEALRESEQRYRLFVQNFTGIAYQLEQGRTLPRLMEGASVEICGYPADAFLRGDVCWPNLIDERDRDRILQRGRWLYATQDGMSDDEYRVVHKSGEIRWVRDIARHIVDEETGRSFIQGAIYDMTDRKRAEEERLEMERRLLHAQKLESMGVLAGGIAHDFNNLLVAILGNAGLALMQLAPESPARQTVQDIELAAQRAAELTRQMLAYSGKGKFVIERINLSRLVEEMAHLLEVSVSKRATVRYRFPEELPTVEGDSTQIRQVIMNLILNASDALGDSPGVISISTGTMIADREYLTGPFTDGSLPEGQYVYVEVSDTGAGMDEGTRSRIFDPFFSTKFAGRGLGLAAVLGIVRGHQGAIKLYSEVGKGSTFKVLFPALAGAAPVAEASKAAPDENAAAGRTILVVDDDPTVRAVTRRILEHEGFVTLLAEDG